MSTSMMMRFMLFIRAFGFFVAAYQHFEGWKRIMFGKFEWGRALVYELLATLWLRPFVDIWSSITYLDIAQHV
jgi:hypothetical protein